MTTNLPVLRADQLPAVRPRCALDVRTPPPSTPTAAPPRRIDALTVAVTVGLVLLLTGALITTTF